MRGRRLYLRVAGLALALSLLPFGVLAFAQQAASFVVMPIGGAPKSAITFYGAGYAPGEVIEIIIVVDGVPTDLGRKPMIKKANEFGAFKIMGNIPRNAKPGMHTIQAIGDKGTVAAAPLEVIKKEQKK
jgi:hypothetical protein